MTGTSAADRFRPNEMPAVENQFDAARLEETDEESGDEESDTDSGTAVSVVADAAVAR